MTRVLNFFKRLWPKRLLGQTVLLVLIALFMAQIIVALIVRSEARTFYSGAEVRFLTERIAPYAKLMDETPPVQRDQLASVLSNRRLTIWLSPEAAVSAVAVPSTDDTEGYRWHARDLASSLAAELKGMHKDRIRVFHQEHDSAHDRMHPKSMIMNNALNHVRLPDRVKRSDTIISVALVGDQWMNAALSTPPPRRLIRPDAWFTFLIAACAITFIVFIALGRITRPLGALSEAARKLGRGEDVEPLKENGPDDVKDTIRAFNEMQDRLKTFVRERTRMLAAISHDLRTPITALRLRAEMLDDTEASERMIATLSDMQDMIEATLAFARQELSDEPTRPCKLAELLEAVIGDLDTLGHEIDLSVINSPVYPCRPLALRRALSNLIENAALYGQKVHVTLDLQRRSPTIRIEDNGPGIPEDQMERIFEPFVRLETSRSTETGGSGLGLSIARDIIRRHGGDVTLENMEQGGLRVTVTLPPVNEQGAGT
ncbi:ATP-binding protein [Thalassospiraceae bacterium LMO-JJ14]|nr:ATP-binding protein [Thalassospiraceae bacterium LMO-JJ14]